MRITRSTGLTINRPTKQLALLGVITLALVSGLVTATLLSITPVKAIIPPAPCYSFNPGTGTMEAYYDHEGGNAANPACPKDVDIPASIEGVPVTSIGSFAFSNRQLTSVTIPSSVTSIGNSAFSYNQLTSVTIPSSVTSIGNSAFYHSNLTSVVISDGITSIGENAFRENSLTSISIPGTATSIGLGAFMLNDLTSVTLSEGVETVDNSAFAYNQLVSITIPSSVTGIGNSAFTNNQLSSITIPNNVTSIGDHAFSANNLTSATLPTGITSIGVSVFAQNELTSVTIPSSVTSIGNAAFSDNNLTSVTIPSGVTSIGAHAFSNNELTSVTIPSGVTSIENNVFYRNKLTSVIIPSGVTSIGSYAFDSNLLTSITLPSSVTGVGQYAFYGNQITNPVILGDPTGDYTAFQYNPITSISYDGTVHTAIATPATPVDACFDFNSGTGEINQYQLFSLTLLKAGIACIDRNVVVPSTIGGDAVTGVGSAFGFLGLTGLTFPSTVTDEPGVDFNKLTSLTLPSSLTELTGWTYAFNSLTRVQIPSGVTLIEPDAFFAQSPWGGSMYVGGDGSIDIYSDDPLVAQHVYDNLWYVRVYTADPANPTALKDSADSESWEIGDGNENGIENESVGGHIINPASTTVRYHDSDGNSIASDVTVTGLKTGKSPSSALDSSDYLHTYLVTESAVPAPLDIYDPTPEEITAMEQGFDQYYRLGDSVTFIPKAITGYTAPSSQTVALSEEDNVVTFVYSGSTGSNPISVSFENSSIVNGVVITTTPPAGVHSPIISKSRLGIVPGGDCTALQSAHLLSPATITATNIPDGVSLLGGIDFSLSCSSGGTTGVNYLLGSNIKDTSKLRAYKYNTSTQQLTDITHLVAISSQTIDGELKTVITYSLTDGGELDEDGIANGTIEDPIVIGYSGDVAELAETGLNLWAILALPLGVMMIGGGILKQTTYAKIATRRK